jgi:hypothetical protein
MTTGKVALERVYAVTSLTAHQTDAAGITRRVRRHLGIKNKIHHVRDTTFAEDAPQAPPEGTPHPRPDRDRTPRHGGPA